MWRNLIKIMPRAIVRSGLTVLTGLADDVIVYLKLVLMSPVIKIHGITIFIGHSPFSLRP